MMAQSRNLVFGLFRELSRSNWRFALSEFQRAGLSEDRGVELREFLLEGLAKELPDDIDWGLLFRRLENELAEEAVSVLSVVQGPLLSRWMEVDAKAAEKWFRSGAARAIFRKVEKSSLLSGSFGRVITRETESLGVGSLANAAGYWLLRDPKNAMNWLRDHKEIFPELLATTGFRCGPAERRICREALVFCLNRVERDQLMTQVVADQENRDIGQALLEEQGRELVEEISELNLSDLVAAKVRAAFGGPE